jgi:CRP/FNR family transcriptional regulator, cyclic AMP receptor protein
MIKSDGPGTGGYRPQNNEDDRIIAPRSPASKPAANNGFAGTGFGNSGFAPSGFAPSGFAPSGFSNSGGGGFSNSGFGPSGIVPTNAPGMPQTVVGLLQALHGAAGPDTVKLTLGVAQWQILSGYMQTFTMEEGQALIEQGAKDTTVYIVEAGSLNVYHADASGQGQVVIVGPGSCVGEGSFFSRMPRNATVHAASRCKLWSITPMRFTELSNRYPAVALSLVMALGSVVARRLGNRPKRGAVT